MKPNPSDKPSPDANDEQRRAFLLKAATYGVATPAAIVLMMSAGDRKAAAAMPPSICKDPCEQ